MPHLALFFALSGLAGSLTPSVSTEQLLWSPQVMAYAVPAAPFHAKTLTAARALLGVPYHYAGSGPEHCPTGEHPACVDCSGLIHLAYAAAGMAVPRTAASLAEAGKPVAREELLPGDILLFRADGSRRGPVDHGGLYLGNGLFLHAGRRGVRLDDLDSPYWDDPKQPRLRCIRRVAPSPLLAQGAESDGESRPIPLRKTP